MTPRAASRRPNSRRGISYPEVLMSALVVGVMLVGAMNLLASVVRGRTATGQSIRAHHYGQQLLTEVLNTAYIDSTSPVFGPEPGEAAGTRNNFDDVDDYNGWNESPLLTRTGTTLTNSTGWHRTITVAWADPAAPSSTSVFDQGLKRITVTVLLSGRTLATLVALRGNSSP